MLQTRSFPAPQYPEKLRLSKADDRDVLTGGGSRGVRRAHNEGVGLGESGHHRAILPREGGNMQVPAIVRARKRANVILPPVVFRQRRVENGWHRFRSITWKSAQNIDRWPEKQQRANHS